MQTGFTQHERDVLIDNVQPVLYSSDASYILIKIPSNSKIKFLI